MDNEVHAADPPARGLPLARDRWRPVGTPGGEIGALLPPAEIDGAEPVMGRVPALGEHTAAVRAEFGAG